MKKQILYSEFYILLLEHIQCYLKYSFESAERLTSDTYSIDPSS